MHILFITDNFPPESNAPAIRTFEHTREWVKNGHIVTVITCSPNFPDGKLFEGYKNKWIHKEIIDDINIWRVKTYMTSNEGFFKRSIDYISFMFSSILFGVFTKKVDVVIGTSPQFFTIISAWFLAKLKRVPFIFELRDIWPASITAVGAMKSSWIITTLEKIELFMYRQSKLIISVTNSFKKELYKRGIDQNKIKVIHNGVDLDKYKPSQKKDYYFIKKFNLKDKFVVGYIGTHGLAHSLDNIIDAAEKIQRNDNIRFVFAGGGADRKRLEKVVQERNLTNVVMIPRQPREKMPNLWSICDVSLVHLKDTPLFRTVIPSKIFESMGAGLPILISVPKGEATEIIEKTNSGIILPPEDSKALFKAILLIQKNNDLYNKLSINSAKASKFYNRKTIALEMLGYIEELVD